MKNISVYIIKIVIGISKLFFNIIYFFLKCFPSKEKVVLLSRQSNKPSIDFKFIEKEILKRSNKVKVKVLCKMLEKDFIQTIKYSFYILKCMYHIATAKICIVDGYSIPISILKHKKSLKIIQIWHASGAIKKFGYQSLDKKEGTGAQIAKAMNMHKNYTYVMAPSNATAKFYEEAFCVEEDKIFINGLPRLDYLLDKQLGKDKINEFYEEYPKFKNSKKIILYVPTFRKDKDCTEIIKGITKSINLEKYNLIMKLHPLDRTSEVEAYTVSRKYNTFDLLKIADYIITDYSAVAFEASILDKPLYFYTYDIKDYNEIRGLNVDLFKEMNSSTSTSIKEIIKAIEEDSYDYEELDKFKSKYMEHSYNNTEKLVDFIFKYLGKDVENEKNKETINGTSKEELNI